MRWVEINVETTNEAQEAVSGIMNENGCNGTVTIEGESPIVRGYLPVDDRLENRLMDMKSRISALPEFGLDAGPGTLTINYVEEEDWAESWKQYFKTTRIGKHIVIKPTWEDYSPEKKDIVIEIDPGMAFGTGSHDTTRLCLEMLETYLKPGMKVVDFGTGSGILAIAAAKMRASLVIAFDVDEFAVKAARDNVVLNEMEEHIEVHQAGSPSFINIPVDLVTANLVAEVINANAENIARMMRIGGVLIASGITREKSAIVEQVLRNVGFDILKKLKGGEWVAISAVKAR